MLKTLVTILMVVTVSLGLVLATGCKSEPIEVSRTKSKGWAEEEGYYVYYEVTVNEATGSISGTLPLPEAPVDFQINSLPDIKLYYENSVLTKLIIDGKIVNLFRDITFYWRNGQLTKIVYNGRTYYKGDKLFIGENQWEITSEFNGSNVTTLEIHNGKVILSDGTHEIELKGVYRVLEAP